MVEIERLHTNDKVEIIDETNLHFGKLGVVVYITTTSAENLKTGKFREVQYANVRLVDNDTIVKFDSIAKPIQSQIKKL